MDSDYDANDMYKVEIISLEETKEKHYLCKSAFEYEKKNTYGIENQKNMTNDMTFIRNNEVKNIPEFYLLHDIINPPKRAKI